MSEEIVKSIEIIMEGIVFKTTVGTTVSALLGWLFFGIKKANKKIKDAATTDDLERVEKDANKYTNEQIKIHEDKQVIEIESMKKDITETHAMVSYMYKLHLNKAE